MTDTSLVRPVASPDKSTGSRLDAWAERLGISRRTLIAGIVLPVLSLIAIAATLVAAPGDDRTLIVLSTLVAVAAGLSSTAIGVYGGVLVPGLLLLGVDARFAAA